jgi:multidrug efflux system membrane fusion protein
MFSVAFWAAERTGEVSMKRVAYLVLLLAVAAAFYVYAYPRLAGKTGMADAQQGAGRHGSFAVSVVSAVARKQTLPITQSAVGFVEPDKTVVVRARATGTVVASNVTEGQMVRQGDLLFRLDDAAQQAAIAKDQAQILKDQANAKAAQATLERDQSLFKKAVIPQSTLDADSAAAEAAAATVKVDEAQLKADQVTLSYMTITAPIAGRVGTVNTSVGNVVSATDTSPGGLVTITPMDPLRVSFNIPERDLDSFRRALASGKGVPVTIRAPDDTADRAVGRLSFIDSSIDTASGTIDVKADVENGAGKLWPGQYVTATTRLGSYDNVTTVPVVAVQQSNDGPFVFVIGAGSKIRRVPVTVTATIGDTAIVGDAIKPGDHVVTEGQLRITQGSTVRETVQAAAGSAAGDDGSHTGGAGASGGGGAGAAPAATAGNS